jgi:hypothetical protein
MEHKGLDGEDQHPALKIHMVGLQERPCGLDLPGLGFGKIQTGRYRPARTMLFPALKRITLSPSVPTRREHGFGASSYSSVTLNPL